jgi:hypothetical protein
MRYGSALLGVGETAISPEVGLAKKLTVRSHKEKADSFLVHFMDPQTCGEKHKIFYIQQVRSSIRQNNFK